MGGLAGLVAGAALYDVFASRRGWETISTGFRRCYRQGPSRLLVGAAVGALIAHLAESGS